MSSGRAFTLSRRKVIVDRWLAIVEAQRLGGTASTTRSEFCDSHGVSQSSLERWLSARQMAVAVSKRG